MAKTSTYSDDDINNLVNARVSDVLAGLMHANALGGGGGYGNLPGASMLQFPGLQPNTSPGANLNPLPYSAPLGTAPGYGMIAPGGAGLIYGGGTPFKPNFAAERINNSMVALNQTLKAAQQLRNANIDWSSIGQRFASLFGGGGGGGGGS